MEIFFIVLFVLLVVLAVALEWYHSRQLTADDEGSTRASPGFKAFRNNYLLVYSLMMGVLQAAVNIHAVHSLFKDCYDD